MHIKTSTWVAAGILTLAGTPLALHLCAGSDKSGHAANWVKALHGGGGHGAAVAANSAPAASTSSATLSVSPTSVSLQTSSANLAGKWMVTMESPQGSVQSAMTLEQKGTKLTGTFANPHAEGTFPVTGEIKDGAIALLVEGKTEHGDMRLDFKGTVKKEDGSLSGTLMSGMGESKWSAARAKD
jgi:hypothetical protein